MEACCNTDDATDCPTKCHQDSFLSVPVAGHRVWLHPPHDQVRRYLLHYRKEKLKDPEHTSVVIVLPNTKGRQSDWLRLLTGFELVAQYTHKDRIFKRSKDGGCYPRAGNTDI